MTRLRLLRQRAARRGVYLLAAYPDTSKFDVFAESESILGPRGLSLSKRQAVLLAAQIASHPSGPVRLMSI
jgi:hypothetical protein